MTDSASPLHASHGDDSDGGNSATHKRKGRLTLFVGAAPGVGKTYTMLRQAVNLLSRGVDVVVGHVDVHARPEAAKLLTNPTDYMINQADVVDLHVVSNMRE